MPDTEQIKLLAKQAIEILISKNLTIAITESMTGGGFTYFLTSVPGVSKVVMGGIVAYSIESKSGFLSVSQNTIKTNGVVSEAVAREMAYGIKTKFKTSIGMGVTGYAGPGGGDQFAPVGRVYWGYVGPDGRDVLELNLTEDREQNRLEAIERGLEWLLNKVK